MLNIHPEQCLSADISYIAPDWFIANTTPAAYCCHDIIPHF